MPWHGFMLAFAIGRLPIYASRRRFAALWEYVVERDGMISAVAASTFSYPAPGARSSVALESQLAKYEVRLADWVSCPSCKTPEGKAKIAEISAKISELKQQIQSTESSPSTSATNTTAAVSVDSDRETTASNTYQKTSNRSAPHRVSASDSVGSLIDVYV